MKRFLAVIGLLCLAGFAHASQDVGISSNTTTSIPFGVLCGGGKRGILYSVDVSSSGGQSSGITVYNSSFTQVSVNQIGPIDGRTVGTHTYKTLFPRGMAYTSTTTLHSIEYDCY